MCHALRDTGTSPGPCPQGWQTSHAVRGSSWWIGRVRGSEGRPRTGWRIIPGRAETWGKPRLSSSGKAAPGPRGECASWRLPGARPAAGRPGRTPGPPAGSGHPRAGGPSHVSDVALPRSLPGTGSPPSPPGRIVLGPRGSGSGVPVSARRARPCAPSASDMRPRCRGS